MFSRAAITLGIGPHSSLFCTHRVVMSRVSNCLYSFQFVQVMTEFCVDNADNYRSDTAFCLGCRRSSGYCTRPGNRRWQQCTSPRKSRVVPTSKQWSRRLTSGQRPRTRDETLEVDHQEDHVKRQHLHPARRCDCPQRNRSDVRSYKATRIVKVVRWF